jgi:putative ABC transport system permease protein
VCANTMGMAVRDRAGQLAVMKCLGFPSRYLLALILTEGGLLTLVGGAIGTGATYALFARGFGLGFGPLSRFHVSAADVLTGIGLSVAIGLVAAAVPAITASRVAPVLTLRQVK